MRLTERRRLSPLTFSLLLCAGTACGRSDTVLVGDGESTSFGTEDETVGPTSDPTGPRPDLPTTQECVLDFDCVAEDPCFAGRCIEGSCEFDFTDMDQDGVPPIGCGGSDCNDLNPNTFPGAPENCFDGDDNDCNGVADCFDPVCADVPDCGCTPAPGGEVCTNGQDDDCDTTVDCLDADCAGTPECGCAPTESICGNGFDEDCDGFTDCEDSECAGDPSCACVGQVESCSNGQDDDCNDLIDCADPSCVGQGPCICIGPPIPEQCSDGADNDCDMLVDCADPDCVVSPACMMCSPEQCGDGIDNDCDLEIDCADEACAFDPSCAPTPELCNNGVDDDNDGDIDCDDLDCVNVPVCVEQQATCETARKITGSGTYTGDTSGNTPKVKGSCGGDAGEAVFELTLSQPSRVELDSIGTSFDSVLHVRTGNCGEGREVACDDDSGGFQWSARIVFDILYPGTYYVFLDGFTIDPVGGSNEGPFVLNVDIEENPQERCDDGIDNDGDVYVDCGDPDCAMSVECFACVLGGGTPSAEFGVDKCGDGIDNDCDGDIDCEDEDCTASPENTTECCNGMDQNGNGIPDDFNCRCNNSGECSGGQVCYTNTAQACGLPCTSFFGDVCPFLAPGSVCNPVTQQCEF